MEHNWGLIVVSGIIIGIFIMIAVHWMLSKNGKTKNAPYQEKNTWETENLRWQKKKRIQEHSKMISKNPIKPFRPKPFKPNKEKFEDSPTIQCISCGQIFRCDWKDPLLIVHEEQELMINKNWKGFEKI